MVDVNIVIPAVLLVIFFMSFPLVLQFFVRSRCRGKHLATIIEKGKPMKIKLLKINRDDFVKDGEDEWMLKTNLMKPIDYPIGWPKMLAGFQQSVWCSLLMRGRTDPLNWEDPPAGALSSKELPALLDPHWLINLVKGVGADTKVSKGERILAMISAGAGVLAILGVIYVISRLGEIQHSIELLRAIAR